MGINGDQASALWGWHQGKTEAHSSYPGLDGLRLEAALCVSALAGGLGLVEAGQVVRGWEGSNPQLLGGGAAGGTPRSSGRRKRLGKQTRLLGGQGHATVIFMIGSLFILNEP